MASVDGSQLYVTAASQDVLVVDASTGRVARTIHLPRVVDEVTPLSDGRFLAWENRFQEANLNLTSADPEEEFDVDAATGAVVATTDIPYSMGLVEYAAAANGRVAVTIGHSASPAAPGSPTPAFEAYVTDPSTGTVTHDVNGEGVFRPLVLSPDGEHAYVVEWARNVSQPGYVLDIETRTGTVNTIPVGPGPWDVTFSGDSSRAFVSRQVSSTGQGGAVDVIDTASASVEKTIEEPAGSVSHVLTTADGSIVVAKADPDTLAIDTRSLAVSHVNLGLISPLMTLPGTTEIASASILGYDVEDARTGLLTRYFHAGFNPGRNGETIVGRRFFWLGNGATPTTSSLNVVDFAQTSATTISAKDRYETSVATSKASFPKGAPVVYVSPGTSFPDATDAAAAAAAAQVPLLLTPGSGISSVILAEIKRLHAGRIVAVAGSASYQAAVARTARSIGVSLVHVAGTDRYATSRATLQAGTLGQGRTVYVATGQSYEPAVVTASVAGAERSPFLLVNGAAPVIDPATKAAVSALHPQNIVLVGSTREISSGVQTSLAKLAPTSRIAGSSDTETARLLDDTAYPQATSAVLATTANFADALAAVNVAVRSGQPLEIVPSRCIPQSFTNEFVLRQATGVTLVGGDSDHYLSGGALVPCK
ncbi:cell wall-binding repeat-containing protein [Frondihabitans sp. 762G35]|uniref:cell wall-binding repeat-containing protein n=1 Tax=Frondihabitans sp. 762G35 TaxID=1446794 RepID=UPI0013DCA06A|nr:cell wall-binding repeat-containing protein [Frondihabitans sp. 762G35]